MAPAGAQEAQGSPSRHPGGPQEILRRPQDAPRMRPGGSQNAPKTPPKRPQDAPRKLRMPQGDLQLCCLYMLCTGRTRLLGLLSLWQRSDIGLHARLPALPTSTTSMETNPAEPQICIKFGDQLQTELLPRPKNGPVWKELLAHPPTGTLITARGSDPSINRGFGPIELMLDLQTST